MNAVKVRQIPIDSLILLLIIAMTAISAGFLLLTIDFNPNSIRYAYREATRYPFGIGAILIGMFMLGRIAFMLITGKLFRVVIELTHTHVHHYPFQTAIPYQAITAIEVPRKGEDSDVRLIRIRWQPLGSHTLQTYYLDFRQHLRFNKTFERVLHELEVRTGLEAAEIPWPQEVSKLPAFYRVRPF